MKRLVTGTLLAVAATLAICAAPAMPAAAATSGTETFSGTIVFSGVPGTGTRTVTASVVRAQGLFRGAGRFVEVVSADAAGVSRDDLVFSSGTIHLVSRLGTGPYTVNPHSCLFTATFPLAWEVTGGTGQFTGAAGSFTGTVSGRARLARNPDGSCSFTLLPPSHEVDKFTESGTLSL